MTLMLSSALSLASLIAMTIDLSPSTLSILSLFITSMTGVMMAWISMKQTALNKTVHQIQEHTNSMKDALVASTAKASHAEGREEGREEGQVELLKTKREK